jgi:hypothetical protein
MSHEGIRFISEEEAQKLAQETEHRDLPREATEPARVRVQKTTGTGMEIDWKDGHQSSWNFTWLRDACPCATCHEERGATGRKPGEPKPQPAGAAADVQSTGAAGVRFPRRPLRHQLSLERRPPERDLLLGLPSPPLPMRPVPAAEPR